MIFNFDPDRVSCCVERTMPGRKGGGRKERSDGRRGNNILGGEGKEENDGAKRRTLKRGERRSHGGLPRQERIPAVKLMMLSKPRHFSIDGWKVGREEGRVEDATAST